MSRPTSSSTHPKHKPRILDKTAAANSRCGGLPEVSRNLVRAESGRRNLFRYRLFRECQRLESFRMRFPAIWYRVGSAAKRYLIFTVKGPPQRTSVHGFRPSTQGSAMRSHQHRTPETPRLRRRLFRREERASLAAHRVVFPFRGCKRCICAAIGPQSDPLRVYALPCAAPSPAVRPTSVVPTP